MGKQIEPVKVMFGTTEEKTKMLERINLESLYIFLACGVGVVAVGVIGVVIATVWAAISSA
jgi:hypothetical protein